MHKQTKIKAKAEVMVQIGLELRCLISTMTDHHDLNLPFLFSKLDIKYGFWSMDVGDESAWNFCYVLPFLTPVNSINDIKIVVPKSLQMGCCEISPFFCYITETSRDVILKLIDIGNPLRPHPFENILLQQMQ